MQKEEGTERISISLPRDTLQLLDDFCEKNHGLSRSKGVAEAIKRLKED